MSFTAIDIVGLVLLSLPQLRALLLQVLPKLMFLPEAFSTKFLNEEGDLFAHLQGIINFALILEAVD